MSRRKHFDDPADDVVGELYHDLSEHLGTDGPEETFGHPDESLVGRLIEDDEGRGPDVTSEVLAIDSHDVSDLTAEEAAIHLVTDDEDDDGGDDAAGWDPSLSRSARMELENY